MDSSNRIMQSLPNVLLDLDLDFAMKNFNKAKYLKFMDKLCEYNEEALKDVEVLITSGDGWEAEFEVVADAVAECAKNLVKKKFFITRARYEIDLAYAMTCFVFPCIMTIEHDNARKACEIMSASWGKQFPSMNNIGVATKEEIHSGFKTKIFGIPIES